MKDKLSHYMVNESSQQLMPSLSFKQEIAMYVHSWHPKYAIT